MKMGVIGAGFIGRALARLAMDSGHEVMIANSRDPKTLGSTAVALGCKTGTAADAAQFGDVVIVSIPFSAISNLDPVGFSGKVVIDTCNHYPARDGENVALDANTDTTGAILARHLPNAKVVKAFNAILQGDLHNDSAPKGAAKRRALPIAGDDSEARALVAGLVDDFGFDVVDAGTMSESWRFERGKPSYCIQLDRAGLEAALAAAEKGVAAPIGSWRRRRDAEAKTAEPERGLTGRGAMDIVDGQFHLSRTEGIAGTLVAMDALGIQSMIVDEVWTRQGGRSQPNVPLQEGHARALTVLGVEAAIVHPARFAFVQRITRHDPRLAALVPLLAETPGCKGLRIVLSSRAERDAVKNGDWDIALGIAAAHDLPVCLLSTDMPEVAATITERFSNLMLILDHCGWGRSTVEWKAILDLSKNPNTLLKWSHATRAFQTFDNPDAAEITGLSDAVAAFGADRVFWASDATFEESKRSWAELLSNILHHPRLTDGDCRKILAGTARRVFKWPLNGPV
jgi:predicted dinucleotide-binding enzyme/predicted TIM-barrel fold metal-dependent hydrolase